MTILEAIKALFAKKNVTLTDEELAELNKIDTDTKPAGTNILPTGTQISSIDMATIKSLEQQVKDLTGLFNEERKAREESTKALAEKMKADEKAKIDVLIEAMKKDGRLEAKNEELEKTHRAMLEANFDTYSKVIETFPKDPTLTKTQTQGQITTSQTPAKNNQPATKLGSSVNPNIMEWVNNNVTENNN